MWKKYRLELIATAVILCFCGFFLYTSSLMGDAEYAGSDTLGASKVAVLAGVSEDEFHPLIPQWEPPSGEVESGLFALQAAAGGIVVGWVFGYWKGQKRRST